MGVASLTTTVIGEERAGGLHDSCKEPASGWTVVVVTWVVVVVRHDLGFAAAGAAEVATKRTEIRVVMTTVSRFT